MSLEKNIMTSEMCKFIVRLHATLADKKFYYFLMGKIYLVWSSLIYIPEPCLGGDLMTLLQSKKYLSESWTRFYAAGLIEAIRFLHKNNIVYRDIKPENLLLDRRGFTQLSDFGLARRTPPNEKRWTFCGTPEYMAPELFLKQGYIHESYIMSHIYFRS